MSAPREPQALRRVLVTGAAGFIGSHLVERLLGMGVEVTGLDNFDPYYEPERKRRNLAGALGDPRFTLVEGDLRDRALLDELLAEPVDVVAHLAAKAGVRPSLEDPEAYLDVNVVGTLRLMDAMRDAASRRGSAPARLVAASSSSVYGAATVAPFAEDDETSRPVSPYAASKKAMEVMAHAYHHLHGLPTTLLRFFTVYGPRQRPEMAIAKFLRRVAAGEPVPMFGDGRSARDYTYIDDIVDGILASMERCAGFHVYNLGNASPVRLDRLIAAVGEAVGREPRIKRLPEQPGDVPLTAADVARAAEELGWRPRMPLVEGLRAYLAWEAQPEEAR